MNSKKKFGFSLTEITLVLGLIGILAITMLALNNFDTNNPKFSTLKLSQADDALRAWSMAISSIDEKGLGIKDSINNQETLDNSIRNYIINKGEDFGEEIVSEITSVSYEIPTVFTLNNGIKIYSRYILEDNTEAYDAIISSSTKVAIIVAEAPDNTREEYNLLMNGKLISVADLHDNGNYTSYPIQTVTVSKSGDKDSSDGEGTGGDGDEKTEYYICLKDDCDCSKSPMPEECKVVKPCTTTTDGKVNTNVYVSKEVTKSSCGANMTGEIVKRKLSDACTDYEQSYSSCCPSPKFDANKGTKARPDCQCNNDKMIALGLYETGKIFDNTVASCQRPVEAGRYAVNGVAVLCGQNIEGTDTNYDVKTTGYYCNTSGLNISMVCPKGYYCPQDLNDIVSAVNSQKNPTIDPDNPNNDNPNKALFNPLKFEKDTDSTNADNVNSSDNDNNQTIIEHVADLAESVINTITNGDNSQEDYPLGGLINPVKCPKGYYCPDDGLRTPKKCRAGHYCPNDGMTTDYICPPGTYSEEGAISCTPCEEGEYQIKSGQDHCDSCPNGTILIDKRTGECAKCKAGYYAAADDDKPAVTAGSKCLPCPAGTIGVNGKCEPCGAGTYQNNEGQTVCLPCDKGTYADEPTIGYTEELPIGNLECEKCPDNSTTDDAGATSITECKCIKGYALEPSQDNQTCDGNVVFTGDANQECTEVGITSYSPDNDNCSYACPANSSTGTLTAESISECKCDAGYATANGQTPNYTDNGCKETPCMSYSPAGDNEVHTCLAPNNYGPAGSDSAAECGQRGNNQIFDNNDPHCAVSDCPLHSTPNDTQTVCNCEKGYYMNDGKCEECPDNSTTDDAGATSITECKCKAGYYAFDEVNNTCPDDAVLSEDMTCKETEAGFFSPEGNNCRIQCGCGNVTKDENGNLVTERASQCVACGNNQYSDPLASETNQCKDKDSNFVLDENKCSQICPAGYGLNNGVCEECPAGTYSDTPNGTCQSCACGKVTQKQDENGNLINVTTGATQCNACGPEYDYSNPNGDNQCKTRQVNEIFDNNNPHCNITGQCDGLRAPNPQDGYTTCICPDEAESFCDPLTEKLDENTCSCISKEPIGAKTCSEYGLAGLIYIETADQLAKIGKDQAYPLNGHYCLVNNIDLETAGYGKSHNNGDGWDPIAGGFSGVFDGNNKTISNLYINRPYTSHQGLFRILSGNNPKIMNLGLVNVDIMGDGYTGGLVGYSYSNSEINNCYVTGKITGTGGYIGGLVGYSSYSNSEINNCYVTGKITGTGGFIGGLIGRGSGNITNSYTNCDVTGDNAGGLVGNGDSVTINASYATGNVTGDIAGGLVGGGDYVYIKTSYATATVFAPGTFYSKCKVGGLVGGLALGNISNSYATGDVTLVGAGYAGGLVGHSGSYSNRIDNCYTTNNIAANDAILVTNFPGGVAREGGAGGLVGENQGNITNSYYLVYDGTHQEGQKDAPKGLIGTDNKRGTPKTHDEMFNTRTFISDVMTANEKWSDNIWYFDCNNDYPRLRNMPAATNVNPIITDEESNMCPITCTEGGKIPNATGTECICPEGMIEVDGICRPDDTCHPGTYKHAVSKPISVNVKDGLTLKYSSYIVLSKEFVIGDFNTTYSRYPITVNLTYCSVSNSDCSNASDKIKTTTKTIYYKQAGMTDNSSSISAKDANNKAVTFANIFDVEVQNNCQPCACGTYTDNNNLTACKTVSTGYITVNDNDEDTFTNATKQIKCPAGKLCKKTNANNICYAVTDCPAGQYSTEGVMTCSACPSNSTTTADGPKNSISDCKCKAGYYTDDSCSDVVNNNSCKTVDTSTVKPYNHYSPAGDNCRHTCPTNSARASYAVNSTYPAADVSECHCIGGYATADGNTPNDTNNACVSTGCMEYSPANDNSIHYCSIDVPNSNYGKANSDSKSNCKIRTATSQIFDNENPHCGIITCPTNSTPNSDGTVCECKAGYYMTTKDGVPYCQACDCGTYNPTKGATSSSVCLSCGNNQYAPKGSASCLTVPSDGTITSNKCSFTCPNRTIKVFRLTRNDSSPTYLSLSALITSARRSDGAHGTSGYCNLAWKVEAHDWSFNPKGTTVHRCSKPTECGRKECTDDQLRRMNYPKAQVNYFVVDASNGNVLGYYTLNNNWYYIDSAITSMSVDSYYEGDSFTGGTDGSKDNKYISGSITINGCSYTYDGSYRLDSPIVLDLKHNGLKFTNVENGVDFDLDGDGKVDRTAWTDYQTEFDDAFLCLDKNGNGQIDNGKELFGDQNGEENGFYELAKYDDNKDDKITPEDKAYNDLRLWCDFNKNAKVDKGELHTLAEEHITELSTKYQVQYDENGNVIKDENGNVTGFVGTFKHLVEEVVNGVKTLVEKVGTMIDVFFQNISGGGE